MVGGVVACVHVYVYACVLVEPRNIVRDSVIFSRSYQQNRHISFQVLLALKQLVSFINGFITCSARIVVDKQTDRHTDHVPLPLLYMCTEG